MRVSEPTLCYFCRMVRRFSHRNEQFLYYRKCDLTGKQIISAFSPDKPQIVYSIDAWWSDKYDPLSTGRPFDFNRPFFEQFTELRNATPRLALQQQLPMENSEDCQCASRLKSGSNLINKKYVIFNEQKTKAEYEDFIRQVDTGSHAVIEKIKTKVEEVLPGPIAKFYHGMNAENCSGDYLRNCKNCHMSFECDRCEDVRYSMCLYDAKNCMDHSYWGGNAEQTYECMACGYDLFNLRFCNICWTNCSDLTYCDDSFPSKNCFGCSGLKKNEYCILNKQYLKDEYVKLVLKIIEHMRVTPLRLPDGSFAGQEWGEFFPVETSVFAYNESLSQNHDPLGKSETLKRGWAWHEAENNKESYLGPSFKMSDNISEVPDAICNQILTCQETGKPFKLIPQEIKFYREGKIPLPRKCPDQRHMERMNLRNPRKLWDRHCANCKKTIATTYSPERPAVRGSEEPSGSRGEKVYCESCYLKEVY